MGRFYTRRFLYANQDCFVTHIFDQYGLPYEALCGMDTAGKKSPQPWHTEDRGSCKVCIRKRDELSREFEDLDRRLNPSYSFTH